MKILILMAGRGKRFNNFLSPKPLIELDGKPMIEHVVDYFPRNSEFIFVCNETHLKTTNIKNILKRIAPNCRIIGIADEMLKGPAYSSFAAFEFIGDNEEVIVNYCDFIQEWDYNDFYNTINKEKPHGAIISFRGFHPSSLGDTYYAYMKVNEDGYVTALKEKESFSEDRTQDYGSTGTYYFATGELFKKYVKKLVSSPTNAVNGEFYMSLPYLFMIDDGLRILNYEAKKFICLGTPRDYELYKFWSEFFLQYTPKFISFDNVNLKVKNIFPLAGGERDFKEVGLNNLNFMVPVMNKPMLHYALYSCPGAVKNIFISLEEHKNEFHEKILPETTRYNSEIVYLKNKTSSNAETILKVQDKIPKDHSVCVSGCTYISDYDERRLTHLMEKDVDVILFSFSHHEWVLRNPDSVHYAKVKDLINVTEVVTKKTISDTPYKDNTLTGTAIYKRSEDLFWSLEEFMKSEKEKRPYFLSAVNELIKKGKKVVIFEVDKFVQIRTIDHYKEFLYWQDFFDKRKYHSYSRQLQ